MIRAARPASGALAWRAVALAWICLCGWGPAATSAATVRAALEGGGRAALVDGRDLFLEAPPLAGEGLFAYCRRLTGDTSSCKVISSVNRNPRRLLAGVRYRVPFELLSPDLKLAVVRAIFPEDRGSGEGWLHRSRGERVSRISLWFSGSESRASEIRAANGRHGDATRAGETIKVPDAVLLPVFRVVATAPPQSPTTPAVPAGDAGAIDPEDEALLEYGSDEQGPYALYRLRGGEALYSAVVVRLTGRDHADDVNALAADIARRSGISDVTDIPIGFPVKIPFEFLLPQYLPEGDPRRLEWEVERKLAEQFRNPVRATSLAGVTVILDAGHGGADVGASRAGVWESIYVYDVVVRIKRALESRTLAKVELTTRDGSSAAPVERDVLPYSRGHMVLTSPPYRIEDASTGVHLRWYLANSIYRARSTAGDGDRIVFLSVHADSLHPSLRGATAYIPNVGGTAGTFGKSGSVFASRREYRERPNVSFSLAERRKSEGRSRDLAERVIRAFRGKGLEVHPFQPVRDRIFRGRRAWVPAVLRYNAVPAKMLLEICNLANDQDRGLLLTREFRERIADAVVDGILAYFGEGR